MQQNITCNITAQLTFAYSQVSATDLDTHTDDGNMNCIFYIRLQIINNNATQCQQVQCEHKGTDWVNWLMY